MKLSDLRDYDAKQANTKSDMSEGVLRTGVLKFTNDRDADQAELVISDFNLSHTRTKLELIFRAISSVVLDRLIKAIKKAGIRRVKKEIN